jgi:ATP-dependent DNA helicase RecG
VEKFGTGVMRIRDAYEDAPTGPAFSVRAGSVAVTLPVVQEVDLTGAEEAVWNAIAKGRRMTRSEISGAAGFSKDKTIRILNTLVARGLVERLGEGPGTRYRRA